MALNSNDPFTNLPSHEVIISFNPYDPAQCLANSQHTINGHCKNKWKHILKFLFNGFNFNSNFPWWLCVTMCYVVRVTMCWFLYYLLQCNNRIKYTYYPSNMHKTDNRRSLMFEKLSTKLNILIWGLQKGWSLIRWQLKYIDQWATACQKLLLSNSRYNSISHTNSKHRCETGFT